MPPRRGAIAPNKPNLAARPGGQGPNVRNKPNFGCGTGILPVSLDHRQDADATIPLGDGTTNLSETRRRLYQTNPIPGGAGGDGARAWDVSYAKQSQSRPKRQGAQVLYGEEPMAN
jgi:hypothetical protein